MPRRPPEARLKLARLVVEGGWVQARATERLQVSRAAVSEWVSRYRAHSRDGLVDHSSRPRTSPSRTDRRTERRIIAVRFTRWWGPHRIGYHLGLPQSTVSKVSNRYRMPLLGRIPDGDGTAPSAGRSAKETRALALTMPSRTPRSTTTPGWSTPRS